MYAHEACQLEVFNAAYSLRKTNQGAQYFFSQTGVEKIIVNMSNCDHGMWDTVVRVTGPCEAESEDEHGVVPVT